MFKLNNKGQSLVMFIIIIPIFLLIITLVYDVGTAIYEKNRLVNTNYMVIEYGVDNIDIVSEVELIELIQKNIDNLNYVSVLIKNNEIEIKLSKDVRGIVGKMFGFDLITANSQYRGTIINGEKKIERIV